MSTWAHATLGLLRSGARIGAGLGLLAWLALAPGCDPREKASTPRPSTPRLSTPRSGDTALPSVPASREDEILARVDDRPISPRDVDEGLQIELHDIALARYRLRAQRLEHLVRQDLAKYPDAKISDNTDRVQILLEPPLPPRLKIPTAGARLKGAASAPVTLVEFIDFQSTHSRALQPVLERILEAFPQQVRLAIRDFTLPYHRNAQQAAEAARCADDQAAYWAYHGLLLLEQHNLKRNDLQRYAHHLGLDQDLFSRCLDENHYAADVRAETALAMDLGIVRAPTLFVNGLYIAPPISYEAVLAVVQQEGAGPALSRTVPAQEARQPPLESGGDGDLDRGLPPLPPVEVESLAKPEIILDLSRESIDQALTERPFLEQRLDTSPGLFSGRRLLEIREVEEGDLYDRFGLEAGDVLMLVDDQWITDQGNPLWQRLKEHDDITLLVMRKGRPHRYRYRIR